MSDAGSEVPKEAFSVYSLIMVMFEQTAEVSWQKLGLHHDVVTGKLEQNLAEAKIAIDLVGHFAELLQPELDDDDRRRIQAIVRDLRINFVQKNKEVGS